MTDMIWMGLSLVALVVATPAVILTDVLRRPAPAPVTPVRVRTGYTGDGVPWVAGWDI